MTESARGHIRIQAFKIAVPTPVPTLLNCIRQEAKIGLWETKLFWSGMTAMNEKTVGQGPSIPTLSTDSNTCWVTAACLSPLKRYRYSRFHGLRHGALHSNRLSDPQYWKKKNSGEITIHNNTKSLSENFVTFSSVANWEVSPGPSRTEHWYWMLSFYRCIIDLYWEIDQEVYFSGLVSFSCLDKPPSARISRHRNTFFRMNCSWIAAQQPVERGVWATIMKGANMY